MTMKKDKMNALERNSSMFLLIGLAISLSFCLLAFKWKTYRQTENRVWNVVIKTRNILLAQTMPGPVQLGAKYRVSVNPEYVNTSHNMERSAVKSHPLVLFRADGTQSIHVIYNVSIIIREHTLRNILYRS